MQNEIKNLSDRLLDFAADGIKLTFKVNRTVAGRYIANQLMRASASSGANYEEACGTESRADFIHKMQIVLKELRESVYWLRLADKVRLITTKDYQPLMDEAGELVKIVAKSVITAKKRRK